MSFAGYVSPEALVPPDHPLRAIRLLVNAALERLSGDFDRLYAAGHVVMENRDALAVAATTTRGTGANDIHQSRGLWRRDQSPAAD